MRYVVPLLYLVLCGCATSKVVQPKKELTTYERDWNFYHHSPAQQRVSAVPPTIYTRTIAFETEQVLEWFVEESPTLNGPWTLVWLESPGLWIGAGTKQVTINSTLPVAFYRAANNWNNKKL